MDSLIFTFIQTWKEFFVNREGSIDLVREQDKHPDKTSVLVPILSAQNWSFNSDFPIRLSRKRSRKGSSKLININKTTC